MARLSGIAIAALAAGVTVACASGGGATAGAPAPIIVTDDREAALSEAIGERVVADNLTVGTSIAATPDQVYRALIVAYSELGVPATAINPTTGLVAATGRRATGRLGDTRLSRYLSCGETMTGPRADQDRVVLSLISRSKPDGSSATRVETTLVATASDIGGTNTRLPCSTTGELESRVHAAVKKALGA
jgi:hypothetical protein